MPNIITSMVKRDLPPIPHLIELTLKVVYDRMASKQDFEDVEDFVMRYHEAIERAKDVLRGKYGASYIDNDPRPIGTKGTELDETQFWVAWCAQRLVQGEQNIGEVARNRLNIARHKLDYRKIYKLDGAVTDKDRAKALYHLKEAMRKNPEDYL